MNKQKIMKWVLPALLMSAMTFEIMPGSVGYYANGQVADRPFNFFTIEAESTAAYCLPVAGMVTMVALVLALVAACMKKNGLYAVVGWCCLAAGSLGAMPYVIRSENEFIQPNVIVILILVVCWLLALAMDKMKPREEENRGRRL